MEPTLRGLGAPTRLIKGRVVLDQAFEVCKEGDVLDSRQTRLLKMFGVQTAEFRVRMLASVFSFFLGLSDGLPVADVISRYWSAATNVVTEVDAMEE